MAVSISLKASTDSGNQLSFGSDNGLYLAPTTPARGGMPGYTIDNAMSTSASAATYYYYLPHNGTTSLTWSTVAQLTPIMFARDCRIAEAAITVSSAGAGSQVNVAFFGSDSNGGPGAKIADVLTFDSTTTGIRPATVLTTRTWTARTLYWQATWASTGNAFPTLAQRNSVYIAHYWRWANRPTVVQGFSTALASLADFTASWSTLTSAPASLTPTEPAQGVAPSQFFTTAPHFCWGLVNV